ncbi:MAG: hypothetical protein AAF194_10195 [Pseudomonadota bacterium]
MSETPTADDRTPNPPDGYAGPCLLNREQQVAAVAQFHAHKIRPNRIAYRMGVDIAFVEALIAGETEAKTFSALLEHFRGQRFKDRMRASNEKRGTARFEQQKQIEKEFNRERMS